MIFYSKQHGNIESSQRLFLYFFLAFDARLDQKNAALCLIPSPLFFSKCPEIDSCEMRYGIGFGTETNAVIGYK